MLYARAMIDPVWWFGTFVWTVDPRESGEGRAAKMPMVLFPKQAELIGWLAEQEAAREGGVIEKSRDFGLTWLCCGYAVHGWLFRPGARYGFGSRKLELVDNKDDDKTIFAKLRYIVDNLPWWMKPADYLDKYCLLKNHDNDNSISGEGGDEIGRGDRTTAYFVDESASLPRPKMVDAALSQTTNSRFDVSTAKGVGNSFYKRRHSGKTKVFTCHWKDDPRKNHYEVRVNGVVVKTGQGDIKDIPPGGKVVYPWYEKEKDELDDDVIVAQEIDIDYHASVEGVCIPAKWVRAAINLCERMALPETGALRASIDLAGGGANRNVLGMLRGVVLREENLYDWRSDSQDWTAGEAKRLCEEKEVTSLVYDAGGGFGGGVADMARNEENPPRFAVRALNGGDPPSELTWPEKGDNGLHKTSKDKFINARAERWWLLRERFRKTWEVVENGKQYPLHELISIPNRAELITDLSKPKVEYASGNRIQIESKMKMRARGVESPDFGDMLSQLEAPLPVVTELSYAIA